MRERSPTHCYLQLIENEVRRSRQKREREKETQYNTLQFTLPLSFSLSLYNMHKFYYWNNVSAWRKTKGAAFFSSFTSLPFSSLF